MKRYALLSLLLLVAKSLAEGTPPAEDRAAILKMAGEFAVTFRFEETVAFQSGYELKKPYTESAHELVVIAKDEPGHIELQHLLVSGGLAIKHWRQVWTFEDVRICEFQGDNIWRMRDLTAGEARGTWSQLVTQVDDSPRYESWGRWSHRAGISSWSSAETWRPLPRRESGRSREYQVIAGMNRHTLTPQGWVHEQDNTKTIVANGKATGIVAREMGVNTYRRLTPDEKVDFTAAQKMWEKDRVFWNQVTDTWAGLQRTRPLFNISGGDRLKELHKAVSKLRATSPSPAGQWPLQETIEGFLTN